MKPLVVLAQYLTLNLVIFSVVRLLLSVKLFIFFFIFLSFLLNNNVYGFADNYIFYGTRDPTY